MLKPLLFVVPVILCFVNQLEEEPDLLKDAATGRKQTERWTGCATKEFSIFQQNAISRLRDHQTSRFFKMTSFFIQILFAKRVNGDARDRGGKPFELDATDMR